MKPSFQQINYSLRPAKHTERRMLCDIFRKASHFHRLSDYTYVGFGGIEFSDFILFHRSLGIREMVSIERAHQTISRIEGNKPFNTIKIVGTSSSIALPKLSWEQPHILWLDNDDPLAPNMLLDVATVANHAASGSMLAVSFQCHKAPEIQEALDKKMNPVSKFVSNFGRDELQPVSRTLS